MAYEQQQATPYIPSVYPEIEEFYKLHPTLYREPKANERGRFYFLEVTKDRPVEKRIDAIYRYKGGARDKEYIFYDEQWRGENHVGNRQEWGWLVGRVDVPYAHFEWDESAHRKIATSVEGHETKYTIEFNDKNIKEISNELHDRTKYYVTDGGITYSIGSQEQFLEWSFDDLMYFGKTGMRPGTQIVTPGSVAADARKQQAEDEKRKRERQSNSNV